MHFLNAFLELKKKHFINNLREWKTIPERFGNFIKMASNYWRLNNKRTLTVPMINNLLNRQESLNDIERNKQQYFGHFAHCPNA